MTFTPTAGTWYTFTYYDADDNNLTSVNDIHRCGSEEPSFNVCNSNGYRMQTWAGIPIQEQNSCGTLSVEQLLNIENALANADDSGEAYYRYSHAVQQLRRHCQFHDCEVTFG